MPVIEVDCQLPCKPETRRVVGEAPEHGVTVEEVAARVGIERVDLIDGKVVRRKGRRRWSLVALRYQARHGT